MEDAPPKGRISLENHVPVLRWKALTPFYDCVLTLSGLGVSFKRKITSRSLGSLVPNTIVDIGSGTGTHLRILRTLYPHAHISGVDPDHALVHALNTNPSFQKLSITLHADSATTLPFASNSIDVCFSTLTFHHLTTHDKHGALREAFRVLKPGGIFVLTDWGKTRIPFLKWLLIFEEKTLLEDHLAGRIPSFAHDAGFLKDIEVRVKPSGIWMWRFIKPLVHTTDTRTP